MLRYEARLLMYHELWIAVKHSSKVLHFVYNDSKFYPIPPF
jgi:hypothetical protein